MLWLQVMESGIINSTTLRQLSSWAQVWLCYVFDCGLTEESRRNRPMSRSAVIPVCSEIFCMHESFWDIVNDNLCRLINGSNVLTGCDTFLWCWHGIIHQRGTKGFLNTVLCVFWRSHVGRRSLHRWDSWDGLHALHGTNQDTHLGDRLQFIFHHWWDRKLLGLGLPSFSCPHVLTF